MHARQLDSKIEIDAKTKPRPFTRYITLMETQGWVWRNANLNSHWISRAGSICRPSKVRHKANTGHLLSVADRYQFTTGHASHTIVYNDFPTERNSVDTIRSPILLFQFGFLHTDNWLILKKKWHWARFFIRIVLKLKERFLLDVCYGTYIFVTVVFTGTSSVFVCPLSYPLV